MAISRILRMWRVSSVAAVFSAIGLCGCVDNTVDLAARQPAAPSARLVARPGVSPSGAALALTSIDGVPESVAQRFRAHFSGAAGARDISLVEPVAAQYRVRGYLTAAQSQGATRYSYVWDIFDKAGRRAQRLTDDVLVAGVSDAWNAIDDKTLTEIARRGAGDLAAFLTNTPEAIAAANGAATGVTFVAGKRAEPAQSGAARPGGMADAR